MLCFPVTNLGLYGPFGHGLGVKSADQSLLRCIHVYEIYSCICVDIVGTTYGYMCNCIYVYTYIHT